MFLFLSLPPATVIEGPPFSSHSSYVWQVHQTFCDLRQAVFCFVLQPDSCRALRSRWIRVSVLIGCKNIEH